MQNTPNLLLKLPEPTDFVLVEDLNENFTKIDTEIAKISDSTTKLETDFTTHLDEKASLTKVGHVQLNSSTTSTDETTAATPKAVKTAMDRADAAFTQANDIKGKWASVVGSPLVSTDTQAQLQSKTQTIKNTLAANLTRKGAIASGTETLTELVNKVDNIKKKLSTEIDTHQTTVPYSVNDDYIWLQDSVSVAGGSTWQWSKYRRENDVLIKRYDGAESVCCFGEVKLINNYIQFFDESTGVLLKSFPKGGIDLLNYTIFFITEDKKFFLLKLKSGGRDIIKYTDTGLVVNSVQTRNYSTGLATSDKNLIINRSGKEFFRVDDLTAQAININQDLAIVMTVNNDYQ